MCVETALPMFMLQNIIKCIYYMNHGWNKVVRKTYKTYK